MDMAYIEGSTVTALAADRVVGDVGPRIEASHAIWDEVWS